jgi:hypothetical protein
MAPVTLDELCGALNRLNALRPWAAQVEGAVGFSRCPHDLEGLLW